VSRLAVYISPSPPHFTEVTALVCAVKDTSQFLCTVFQIRTVPSPDAEASLIVKKEMSVWYIAMYGQTVRAEVRRPFAGRVWAIAEAECGDWEILTVWAGILYAPVPTPKR
jgi:hypothetical protein